MKLKWTSPSKWNSWSAVDYGICCIMVQRPWFWGEYERWEGPFGLYLRITGLEVSLGQTHLS